MALDDNRLPTGETESKVSYLLAHLCCLVMLGSQHLQHLLDIHPQRCTKLDCGRQEKHYKQKGEIQSQKEHVLTNLTHYLETSFKHLHIVD